MRFSSVWDVFSAMKLGSRSGSGASRLRSRLWSDDSPFGSSSPSPLRGGDPFWTTHLPQPRLWYLEHQQNCNTVADLCREVRDERQEMKRVHTLHERERCRLKDQWARRGDQVRATRGSQILCPRASEPPDGPWVPTNVIRVFFLGVSRVSPAARTA